MYAQDIIDLDRYEHDMITDMIMVLISIEFDQNIKNITRSEYV